MKRTGGLFGRNNEEYYYIIAKDYYTGFDKNPFDRTFRSWRSEEEFEDNLDYVLDKKNKYRLLTPEEYL